jgi:hypothetical protein
VQDDPNAVPEFSRALRMIAHARNNSPSTKNFGQKRGSTETMNNEVTRNSLDGLSSCMRGSSRAGNYGHFVKNTKTQLLSTLMDLERVESIKTLETG